MTESAIAPLDTSTTNHSPRLRPLWGLPKSALRQEGETIMLIAVLRPKGLNRDMRRRLAERTEYPEDTAAGHVLGESSKCLEEIDRRLLRRWANPFARRDYYWQAMKVPQNGLLKHIAKDYLIAIDLLWLDAFAPDWKTKKLDEEALTTHCAVWTDIRTSLEERPSVVKAKRNFGVFMLWLDILEELNRWDVLGEERQAIIGRAVFALCSISLTDWFACEAIKICPSLSGEFFLASEDVEHPDEHQQEPDNATRGHDGLWMGLLDRLDAIATELRNSPTQMTVVALQALAEEFGDAAHTLPKSLQPPLEQLREKVGTVLELCRRLAMNREFIWFDLALLNQIEARWELAAKDSGADVAPLLDDANLAVERVEQAATSLRAANENRQSIEIGLGEKTSAIANAITVLTRRALERNKRQAEKDLLALAEQIETLQDRVLAAGSPFNATFDYETDYVSILHPVLAPEPVPQSTQEMEVSEASVDPIASPKPEPIISAVPTEGYWEGCDPEPELPLPPVLGQHDDSPRFLADRANVPANTPPPVSDTAPVTTSEDAVYNIQAGNECQPIWQLLASGRFATASQLTRAMSVQENAPRMPPQPLLETIAIADALMLPDGSLHDAVTARLQEFAEDWFQVQGPDSWHTALNLLLVAATLRPMVLVPGSSASAMASYLHLESKHRYPNLWEFVGLMRESSDRLRGFPINLASFRSARDLAAIDSGLQELQHEAKDWLEKKAPAMTIKFAPATKVWRRWLQKPDGAIHQLLTPVVEGREDATDEVLKRVQELENSISFQKLVRRTDRVDNERRKGDEIHTGALDHLNRCTKDAVVLARRWLPYVETKHPTNDRMRELLLLVRKEIERLLPSVRSELGQADPNPWQLVAYAQKAVLRQFDSLVRIFDPNAPLVTSEPTATEVLVKELLEIPSVRIDPDWVIESTPVELIAAIRQWHAAPLSWQDTFDSRLNSGDLLGAKRLLDYRDADDEFGLNDKLRHGTESWRAKIKSCMIDCRREIEVGSAYGYVSDSERNRYEGELARIEAQSEESLRFDIVIEAIENIHQTIRLNHTEKADLIKQAISELEYEQKKPDDIQAVQTALDEDDMATANELLQRVQRGLPAWQEELTFPDSFESFNTSLRELDTRFSTRHNPDEIRTAIKGGTLPGLDFHKVAGAQRDQAANMYADWSYLKSRKVGDADKLRSLLSALGFLVDNPPVRQETPKGKEIWMLNTAAISDRSICPIPHFGSDAKGNYRLICLWERPTEDDIVQLVGDPNLHRATVVLYFGRMTDRKWRELSRKTKLSRKSFVLIDEMLLLFLAAQAGSRLAALFSASLPYSFADPFDATAGFVPPEMFYGRAAELNAILGLNGRCFIYGGRQLGKTALMRRAKQTFHEPGKDRWSYYIDLRAEGIGVNRAASEIWQTIAIAMKAIGILTDVPTASALTKKAGIDGVLESIRIFLGKNQERRLLLLLDEADRFFEQDGRHDFAETRRLKQLMETTQRRFKVVFAGLHNVLRMTERANHPLAHFGQPIKIGPFIEEHEIREARDLIRHPLAAAGFEFSSRSLVMRILAQTNYYPSLIQLYCNHLLQHMLTRLGAVQNFSGPRYQITNHDIEAVYSSSDLRREIRAKFNFTLQLDSRYEVIAYGMAHEVLVGHFGRAEGMDLRSIWNDCAMKWWPEGFRDTSELDFRALLDEMVELGVLSCFSTGHYGLRNPNVFLLLGNYDEIDTVLKRTRQPAVEFDSAIFHPQLRNTHADHLRHPLTFQQLSVILRPENTVTAITGTTAAEIDHIGENLNIFVQQDGRGICYIMDSIFDHETFMEKLKYLIANRDTKKQSVIIVPCSIPWKNHWVNEVKDILMSLKSPTGHVMICFIADAKWLWTTFFDTQSEQLDIPWVSLLPWRENFVKQYLEDQQLSMPTELIREASGFWPTLLYPLVKGCKQVTELERRAYAVKEQLKGRLELEQLLVKFGLYDATTIAILRTLAEYGEPAEACEITELVPVELDGVSIGLVNRILAWGELLGITRREGQNYWNLDKFVARLLLATGDQ